MKDSPYWTTHSYRSHHLRFLGLTITSPSEGIPGYSTDAIDLDNCHDVLVKDCYMDVCDDGVVLKGGKGTFADKAPENGPNSSILVEDCTFGCAAATAWPPRPSCTANCVPTRPRTTHTLP